MFQPYYYRYKILFIWLCLDEKKCLQESVEYDGLIFFIFVLTTLVVNVMMMTMKVVNLQMNLVKIGEEPMPLQNRLKEYRARLGVNQQQMGQLVGVSRQTISQIERGDYSPSVTLALKIAKICGVTVEDIFTYEEESE